MDIEFVRSRFIKHFDGKTGNVYSSPGRINLIGEHTDYNGGFVFPGAVDKGIMAEIRANGTEDTVMAYFQTLRPQWSQGSMGALRLWHSFGNEKVRRSR